MGRYEKWGDTRLGTKYGDMREVVRYESWNYTRCCVNRYLVRYYVVKKDTLKTL